MICPKCGFRHEMSWFCERCGTRMVDESKVAPQGGGYYPPQQQAPSKPRSSLGMILLVSFLLIWNVGLTLFAALTFTKVLGNEKVIASLSESGDKGETGNNKKITDLQKEVDKLTKSSAYSDVQNLVEDSITSSFFKVDKVTFDEKGKELRPTVYVSMLPTKLNLYEGGTKFKFSDLILKNDLEKLTSDFNTQYDVVKSNYENKVDLLSFKDGVVTYKINGMTVGSVQENKFSRQ